ncbi:hypothetical protein HJ588_16235 [Flexivirga sp. ID2601S]|uniref:Phage tail lysozyme domain-containing protein n=1 Tax=Flexivirga aerilata TaxID=1656889 RepID=A0A849ARA4_9MICO|nr:phage tail tip lysozyme [Flexivirga aerilata]NNG40810.1 hypothetical protein [Flexivirga aerilata]
MHLTRRLTIGCATLVAAATAATPALAADTHVNSVGMSPNASVAALAISTANQDIAFNFFVAKGLTKRQAAGIVGNLTQESGVNPTAQQAGGAGRGIAQWSVGGRWDRYSRDNMVWYAANKAGGVSRWNLNAQLKFTWYELTTYSYYGLAQLKNSTTLRGAVVAFQDRFEGCGTCMTDKRVTYAQQVYNRHV